MDINIKKIEDLLCCPVCIGELKQFASGYLCRQCDTEYPVKDGIISFIEETSENWQTFFLETLNKAANSAEAVGYRGKKNFQIVQHGLRKILAKTGGNVILDVGCGHGVMTGWMAGQNTVVGVDFVRPMLIEAGKKGIIPLHADGMKLPFKRKMFDWVLAVEIIQHIEDGPDFVQYLSQFVKGNGKIVIIGPNVFSILRKISRIIGKIFRTFKEETLPKLWNPIVLAEILKKNDFAVDIFYTCFPFKKIIEERNGIYKKQYLGSDFFIVAKN